MNADRLTIGDALAVARSRIDRLTAAAALKESEAGAVLRDLGFGRATDIDGGFEAWAAAGLPVERPGSDRDRSDRRT